MRKFSIAICIFAVFCFKISNINAKSKTEIDAEFNKKLEPELHKIQKISSQRKSFVVSFEQVTFSALRNRNKTQKGTLKYLAPKSFRWEITTPSLELYVSNGKDFWKYNELAKHAQKLPVNSGDLNFLEVIFNPETWPKNYVISAWTLKKEEKNNDADWENPPAVTDKNIALVLLPKEKSKLKSIRLVLDTDKVFISQIRLYYDNENKSKIDFSNFMEKQNNAADFNFTPPAGIAVDDGISKK